MIRPLEDRVVIQPEKPAEKSKGGIILANQEASSHWGKVLSVGPGKPIPSAAMSYASSEEDYVRIAVGVSVGERVLYASYAQPIELEDGTKVLVLRESEIICVDD